MVLLIWPPFFGIMAMNIGWDLATLAGGRDEAGRSSPFHTFHNNRYFANKWLQKVKRKHDTAKNWYDYS
jgi:hypothetical protein